MKAIVTGGGGFLGKAIIKQLLAEGYEVKSYSRSDYPELKKLGVEHIQGSLSSLEKLKEAFEGCGIVFHTAAKAGIWGKLSDFYSCNVVGTQNVIKACLNLGINKLVYTSSPSVVHDGDKGIEGKSEKGLDYPKYFLANYPKTKAIAEQMVLKANNYKLATVSLRPHIIWGPGDHHFLPRIISKAKSGKLKFIGKKEKLIDTVYIDNAAQAHLLAAKKLSVGSNISGKAYFISQDDPIDSAKFINKILEAASLPIIKKSINPKLAYFAGSLIEGVYSSFGIEKEPPATRFMIKQLSTPHWFDISAAKNDLEYNPNVSIDQGMKIMAEWLKSNNYQF